MSGSRSNSPIDPKAVLAPMFGTPYYAVTFANLRTPIDDEGYGQTADEMVRLAKAQPGYLGFESVRDSNGVGITISYWKDLDSIRRWKEVGDHKTAQKCGHDKWYRAYTLRICKVESERDWFADPA